jgi:cytochrome c553
MSFRPLVAVSALLMMASALAQEPVAEIIAVAEPAPAAVAELTDPHAETAPGDAEAGANKAAVCAACHGMDGNSADPQYPKLAGQHEAYTARHLALFKGGERNNPIMLGFAAALSAQDMRDLGAYYAGQAAMPGVADESLIDNPLSPNQGKRFFEIGQTLFRGGDAARGIPACGACHGPAGRGVPGPTYPSLAGQHAQYTADMLRRFRSGEVHGRGDNANVIMPGVAQGLTDEEIDSLATYIEGLHAMPQAAMTR